MANVTKLTREGLADLQEKLRVLKEVDRVKVIEDIETARGFGDLSENSEYDEAKTRQGKIESEIHELEEIIANAVVVESMQTDAVDVGTVVTVKNITKGVEITYNIVGATESNPMLGKISDRSPIGKALIGCRIGAKVDVETPAGVMTFEILNISR